MNLESRIKDFIFGWDMHNFILDDNVDEKLEPIIDAISSNSIKNINLNHKLLENWKDNKISDGDICNELASYLKGEGNNLIIFETPIPSNIKKDENGFKSWTSNGFGYCVITVMMINSLENMKEKIKEVEEELMEKEYQKQINKVQ